MSDVYLDYNATAPVRPQVAEAVAQTLGTVGNPSSVHGFGRRARRALEDARAEVAALAGASPEAVAFTGSGTEANNWALSSRPRVLASAVEHDSVLAGATERIPVDGNGRVDPAAVDEYLAADDAPALVSVMLANNETGVVQPVADVAEIARRRGARMHTDAVQAAGRLALDMDALDVDLLTLSAHKLGGPQGVGALVVRNVELAPLLRGGGQERRRRAGTENVAGIVGFGVAARLALDERVARMAVLAKLRDDLEARIRAIAPDATIFGRDAERLPNTSCLAMPGVAAELQVMDLDLAGVAVSAGAACSSGKVQASHVLSAMGAGNTAGQAIRVSLGWATTAEDVDRFVAAWEKLYRRLGAARAA